MNQFLTATDAWIEAMGWTLLHSLWQVGLAAMVLAIALRLMHKQAPGLRYNTAVGVLLLAVASLVWRFSAELDTAKTAEATYTPAIATASYYEPEGSPMLYMQGMTQPRMEAAKASYLEQASTALQPYLGWLVAFWVLGLLSMGVRNLGGLWWLSRLRATSLPVDELQLAHWMGLAKRSGLGVGVSFRLSKRIDTPMVMGYLKPLVLVPVELMSQVPAAQLEAVILHELAHIRRHDYLINLLQRWIEACLFFNPASWYINRVIRLEREAACDAYAVAFNGDNLGYVKTLAKIEAFRHKRVQLAMGFAGTRKNQLLDRAKRLLEPPKHESRANRLVLGLLLFALSLGFVLLPYQEIIGIGQEHMPSSLLLTNETSTAPAAIQKIGGSTTPVAPTSWVEDPQVEQDDLLLEYVENQLEMQQTASELSYTAYLLQAMRAQSLGKLAPPDSEEVDEKLEKLEKRLLELEQKLGEQQQRNHELEQQLDEIRLRSEGLTEAERARRRAEAEYHRAETQNNQAEYEHRRAEIARRQAEAEQARRRAEQRARVRSYGFGDGLIIVTPPTPPTPPTPLTAPEPLLEYYFYGDGEGLEGYREQADSLRKVYREQMREYSESYRQEMERYQEQMDSLREQWEPQLDSMRQEQRKNGIYFYRNGEGGSWQYRVQPEGFMFRQRSERNANIRKEMQEMLRDDRYLKKDETLDRLQWDGEDIEINGNIDIKEKDIDRYEDLLRQYFNMRGSDEDADIKIDMTFGSDDEDVNVHIEGTRIEIRTEGDNDGERGRSRSRGRFRNG